MHAVHESLPPRPVLLRGVLAALTLALLVPAAHAYANPQTLQLGPGVVEENATNVTYVSNQGFHFGGRGDSKKPARLVAADERANRLWHFEGGNVDASWFYDIDPLPNGNLLVSSTHSDGTIALEFDVETRSPVWQHDLPINDTHDVARLDDDRLLVANMREYHDGVSDDRLYVVNTTTGDVGWEWLFRDHYPAGTDGGHDDDWTHVNDVDVIDDEGRYVLASPRNFDQVIVVDRETDDVVMRLGEDGDHDVLHEQHNPDYMEREDGTPVVLVADSENDRVVEFERDCGDADPTLGAGTPPADCEWNQVWTVTGLNWPRDADRLPDGDTLIADTLNHRVVEVSPSGEVVWEFHSAWAPYDVERGAKGSNGPTMADEGVNGSYRIHGASDEGPAAEYTVDDAIADLGSGTPLENTSERVATRWAHTEPWIRPVWMGSWAALSTALGLLLGLSWATGEAVFRRRRIADGLRRAWNVARRRLDDLLDER